MNGSNRVALRDLLGRAVRSFRTLVGVAVVVGVGRGPTGSAVLGRRNSLARCAAPEWAANAGSWPSQDAGLHNQVHSQTPEEGESVHYMVIETYKKGPGPVYAQAAESGRMLPPGLAYLDSWVDARSLDRCFQLMETEDPTRFDEWIGNWSDLVEFEIVPVIASADAAERLKNQRGQSAPGW
jgi:Protein of unknown function (DUF3303)